MCIRDSIQGIGVWSRKYHVPIYGTRGTLEEIWRTKSLGKVDESLFHVIRPGETFQINDMTIHPFSIPHDARDPVSLSLIHISTKKTDTSTKKNTEPTKTETSAPETKTPETSAPETKVPETEAPSNDNSYVSDGNVLSKYHGVVYGPTGKETYYNLDMSGVVRIMRDMGFSAEDYPYWVRDDGCKMLGSYIMCAANLNYFPRGTTVASSLGTCLVCDTGSFAASNPTQLDIATNW